MLVKFEPSENEVQKDERDAVEEGLDYPGPEGHVDVDNVSLFPIPNDFLKKQEQAKTGFKTVFVILVLLPRALFDHLKSKFSNLHQVKLYDNTIQYITIHYNTIQFHMGI